MPDSPPPMPQHPKYLMEKLQQASELLSSYRVRLLGAKGASEILKDFAEIETALRESRESLSRYPRIAHASEIISNDVLRQDRMPELMGARSYTRLISSLGAHLVSLGAVSFHVENLPGMYAKQLVCTISVGPTPKPPSGCTSVSTVKEVQEALAR